MKRLKIGILPVILAVLVLAACSPGATPAPAAPPVATQAPVVTQAPQAPVRTAPAPVVTQRPSTPPPVTPKPAEAFSWAGKTMEMIITSDAGGGTDSTGRVVASFLPRYLPGNPKAVVRNQPGAGGVIALNSFYLKAKPDGMSMIQVSSSLFAAQQRARDIVQYDTLKMPALGNVGSSGGLIGIRKSMRAKLTDPSAEPLVMGTRDGSETSNMIPLYGREFLGWNVRWLSGFAGTGETMMAVRRGELDLFLDGGPNLKILMEEGVAEPLAQVGRFKQGKFQRRTDWPDVPVFEELLGDRKPSGDPWTAFMAGILPQVVYKATLVAPGTPDNIVKTMRDAYAKADADPKFHDMLHKVFGEDYQVDVGEDTEKLINEALQVSPEIVGYVDSLLRKFDVIK
ncbi:MAG: hypothetical protein U1D67_10740 [Dehalococcoidia bacterium]|nr:hypothetical protein [Dehalococcoidia bacterium]